MGRHACHVAGERPLSLVRHDNLHIARFAEDAHFGTDTETAHLIDQAPDPDTSNLFIVGKRQMQRRREPPVQEIRQMREGDGDKRLHIAGTAPVQATVLFHHPEWIGIPVLSVDRHDIRVPRQHDTAPVERSRGRVKIRLALVVVESQVRLDPETVQIVPDPVD